MVLEICIDRYESAVNAVQGGADRIEVCSALSLGGLTPSIGLLAQCCELVNVQVMAMIRPRSGDFCYQAAEVDVMLRDIEAARNVGADGVVIGALTSGREIDRPTVDRLLMAAGPMDVTFHRAFDLTIDPQDALRVLMDYGIRRVLTSGQQITAWEGRQLIGQLISKSAGALTVMAGAVGMQPK